MTEIKKKKSFTASFDTVNISKQLGTTERTENIFSGAQTGERDDFNVKNLGKHGYNTASNNRSLTEQKVWKCKSLPTKSKAAISTLRENNVSIWSTKMFSTLLITTGNIIEASETIGRSKVSSTHTHTDPVRV